MELVELIHEVSSAETPVEENVKFQGPGGQTYDLAPNEPVPPYPEPNIPVTRKEKLVGLVKSYPVLSVIGGGLLGAAVGLSLRQVI